MKLILILALTISHAFANIDSYADYIPEARVLVEARLYLKEVKRDLAEGKELDRRALQEWEEELEIVAENGCDCPEENNIIRAQAYALIGAINGVISKETTSVSHAKKSYHTLARARKLDPRNVDAIRGQGVALKAVLSKGRFVRTLAAMTLGINLKREKKNLIRDLRTFRDNPILLNLADQLEKMR